MPQQRGPAAPPADAPPADGRARSLLSTLRRRRGSIHRARRSANLPIALTLSVLFLVLPGGMSGPELAGRAQQRCPGLRVLYTSGYAPGAALAGVLPTGVVLLHKPYRFEDLASKLEQVLEPRPA